MLTKSRLAIAAIAFMFTYVIFNLSRWEEINTLHWDETGYYIYLPAKFIYKDIKTLSFYPTVEERYWLNQGTKWYCIYEVNGGRVNKYPIGVSIFEMPFFFVANWYCHTGTTHMADGYSRPYRAAVIFSFVFWVVVGLYVLRRYLLRYFSEGTTAVTLLLLAFATNLYFYTVFEQGMSHPISFTLFCFLLSATDKWYTSERKLYLVIVGAVLGLIVITRPVNIIVAMLPVLWKYKDGSVKEKLLLFKRQWLAIVFALLAFWAMVMIQCSYWYQVTGRWVYYSYMQEKFDLLSPNTWKGLFSYNKGWFVYTPVAFFGVLGLVPLFMRNRHQALLIFTYLAITVYITFCWWDWAYGGGFGCRPLIESMPVVAIPLATLIQSMFDRKKLALNITMLTIGAFFITLNTFQSYQLANNVTVWSGTNRAFYWRTFGKLKIEQEDRKLLDQ